MTRTPVTPMTMADYQQAYKDRVKKAEGTPELGVLMFANPDIYDKYKEMPDFVCQNFEAMQRFLPKKVWSCPIVGGSLLRQMCDSRYGAGNVLA